MSHAKDIFVALQTPIEFQLTPRTHGKTCKLFEFKLTLASSEDGITIVPICLNYSTASELGHALLAAADHLKAHIQKTSIGGKGPTNET